MVPYFFGWIIDLLQLSSKLGFHLIPLFGFAFHSLKSLNKKDV